MPIKYFAFDTETTGLAPHRGDEIISIAFMLLDEQLNAVHEEQLFVCPTVPVSPEAARVNGYTPDLWESRGAVEQTDLVSRLIQVWEEYKLNRAYPLGQNVGFDVSFLEALSGLYPSMHGPMKKALAYHKIDTITLGAALDHAHGIYDAQYNLGLQCERYGIVLENAHDALSDLRATVELYRKLCAHLKSATPPPAVLAPPFLEKVGEALCFKVGKNRGISIDAVDRGYVRWVLGNVTLREAERDALGKVLQ